MNAANCLRACSAAGLRMGKTTTVACDNCGRDLTVTGNAEAYRLALLNQHIPSRGGFVTCMAEYPAIEADCYFCGIGCLSEWLAREHPRAIARRRKDGTVLGTGAANKTTASET